MKKIIAFTVFAITLVVFSSFVYDQIDLLNQMKKLVKENEELSLQMKKSSSGFISLDAELDEIQKLFKKNKKKSEMQDSVEKKIVLFNYKLSRQLQERTNIVYKYNANRISTVCLLKKIDNIDSINTNFAEVYNMLKIYSDFLDSEYKQFMKFESRIDPIKSLFGSIEKKFAKRQL